jgi:hypothetical protein
MTQQQDDARTARVNPEDYTKAMMAGMQARRKKVDDLSSQLSDAAKALADAKAAMARESARESAEADAAVVQRRKECEEFAKAMGRHKRIVRESVPFGWRVRHFLGI